MENKKIIIELTIEDISELLKLNSINNITQNPTNISTPCDNNLNNNGENDECQVTGLSLGTRRGCINTDYDNINLSPINEVNTGTTLSNTRIRKCNQSINKKFKINDDEIEIEIKVKNNV